MTRFWQRGSPVIFILLVVMVSLLFAAFRHYHTDERTKGHATAWHKCYDSGALQMGGDVMRNCIDFETAHLTAE